jgi:hypothetical protein
MQINLRVQFSVGILVIGLHLPSSLLLLIRVLLLARLLFIEVVELVIR